MEESQGVNVLITAVGVIRAPVVVRARDLGQWPCAQSHSRIDTHEIKGSLIAGQKALFSFFFFFVD